MAKIEKEDIVAVLAEIFAPKKKAKKSDTPDRIVVVDGVIGTQLVTLKQAKKLAKLSATRDITIQTYVLEGTLSVALPVEVTTEKEKKSDEGDK